MFFIFPLTLLSSPLQQSFIFLVAVFALLPDLCYTNKNAFSPNTEHQMEKEAWTWQKTTLNRFLKFLLKLVKQSVITKVSLKIHSRNANLNAICSSLSRCLHKKFLLRLVICFAFDISVSFIAVKSAIFPTAAEVCWHKQKLKGLLTQLRKAQRIHVFSAFAMLHPRLLTIWFIASNSSRRYFMEQD